MRRAVNTVPKALESPDKYGVAFAPNYSGSIHMVEAEHVVRTGGRLGQYVICAHN